MLGMAFIDMLLLMLFIRINSNAYQLEYMKLLSAFFLDFVIVSQRLSWCGSQVKICV